MVHIPSNLSFSFEWLKLIKSSFIICCLIVFTIGSSSVFAEVTKKDSDNDGLSDAYEIEIGSEIYLSDTDGDNIKDGDEIGNSLDSPIDSDNDGLINILDYDDDDDGLPTYLESTKDTDKDGLLDYLDTDSDNDSVLDGIEAAYSNEDINLDGIDDAFDVGRDGSIDINGDGIDDNVKLPDHDDDGKPDYLDANYPTPNNDTLTEKDQPETKTDSNVKKEVIVEPSKEVEEPVKEFAKVNEKQQPKKEVEEIKPSKPKTLVNRHTDSDNDGLSNELEKKLKTNHLKRDTDGDNISDAIEIGLDVNAPQDSDNDGIIDALDNDDDNDGILTKLEDLNKDSTGINDDTDGDGIPNYLDDNDDGDNLLTKEESFVLDSDSDGILDYLDKSDGKQNEANSSNTMKVANNDIIPAKPEVVVLYDAGASANNDNITTSAFQMKITTDLGDEEPMLNDIVYANQDQLLSSLDETVETSQLVTDKISNDEVPVIQRTSMNDRKSHWDLF